MYIYYIYDIFIILLTVTYTIWVGKENNKEILFTVSASRTAIRIVTVFSKNHSLKGVNKLPNKV